MKEKIQRLIASPNLDDVKLGMNLLIREDLSKYRLRDDDDFVDFRLHDEDWEDYMYIITKGKDSIFLNTRGIGYLSADDDKFNNILNLWGNDPEDIEHIIIET